eukprot:3970-Heterococcus_DN1.PRE.2
MVSHLPQNHHSSLHLKQAKQRRIDCYLRPGPYVTMSRKESSNKQLRSAWILRERVDHARTDRASSSSLVRCSQAIADARASPETYLHLQLFCTAAACGCASAAACGEALSQ